MKKIVTCALVALMTLTATAKSDGFCIAKDGKAATIVVDKNDWKSVLKAVDDLSDDVRKVTGVASDVMDNGQWTVILTLDQPIQPGELYEFELAGPDGIFHAVPATASGNTIEIKAAANSQLFTLHSSLKLRYAWKDNPLRANVRSLSGLPMSSFEMEIKQ